MSRICKESMQTWIETVELVGRDEKKLHDAKNIYMLFEKISSCVVYILLVLFNDLQIFFFNGFLDN